MKAIYMKNELNKKYSIGNYNYLTLYKYKIFKKLVKDHSYFYIVVTVLMFCNY